MRFLILAAVVALASCASSQKNPSRFMEKSVEARRDTARHLRALNELCRLEEATAQPNYEFCVEALKVREAAGEKAGISARASQLCGKGSAEACVVWTRAAGNEGDLRLARDALTRSCEEDVSYCMVSAILEYRHGSAQEGLKRLKKGCAAGNLQACEYQGRLSLQQDDLGGAAVAFQKACNGGIEEACFEKSLVTRVKGKDVSADLDRACKAGVHPLACDLAEVDTLKSLEKDWVAKNDRACRKEGGENCYRAALDQYFRPGGKNLAKFRFRNQCNETPDGARNCFMNLYVTRPLGFEPEDETDLKKFCEQGAKTACFEIGRTAIQADPTVKVSKIPAENLAEACESERRPESCEEKARIEFESGNGANAEHFMQVACDLGSEDGCTWLGKQAEQAQPPRITEARRFYRRGCLDGSVVGCELLTELVRPVENSPAK